MPKKQSKLPVDPNKKEQLHYNAILLEEIRSQMNGVIETVQLTKESLETKIDESKDELKQEIQILQIAVGKNSEDIKKNSEDIKRLEQKLDLVVEKVDRHDEEIVFLKTSLSQA